MVGFCSSESAVLAGIEEEGSSFVDDVGLTECAFTVNKGSDATGCVSSKSKSSWFVHGFSVILDVNSDTINTYVGNEQFRDFKDLNLVCYVWSRDADISKYSHHSAVSQCTHCIQELTGWMWFHMIWW